MQKLRKIQVIWRSLISLCFFLSISGMAKDRVPILPGKQAGLITFSSEYGLDKDALEAWTKFCKRLGKELSFPGPGFLSSYTCQASDSPRPSPSRSWHIELIERKHTFELRLHFLIDAESQDIQSLSFAIEDQVLETIENEVLPVALARMLVESNPTGWAYKHNEEGPSFRTRGELLPFPQDLLVYRLYFDKKEEFWIPSLYARISKVKDREAGEDSEKIKYSVDVRYRPLQIGKEYWVRSLDNEERQSKYQSMITAALQGKSALPLRKTSKKKNFEKEKNFIDDYLLGSIRSSYAGFRYGKSIAKSDFIINEVDMVSILAEIGAGPLAGLRWYYDVFPELKRGSGNEQEYFSLRRASLGWAFSWKMPSLVHPLVTKIDLQPKIGLLDLKSHFFVPTPNGRAGLDFNVKNIFDLALEIGVEKSAAWFRSRLWGAISTANLGVSNKSSVTVKSLRGGIDLYFDLFEAERWNVNILTFANLENLEIAKDPKSLDLRFVELHAINPTLAFAGVGFTISW